MSAASLEQVERCIAQLNRVIRAHAGGLVLEEIAPNGVVRVRFTGMCAGCEARPLTMIGSVRPALMAIRGVTGVDVIGVRLSTEAEEEIARDLHSYGAEVNIARALAAMDFIDGSGTAPRGTFWRDAGEDEDPIADRGADRAPGGILL